MHQPKWVTMHYTEMGIRILHSTRVVVIMPGEEYFSVDREKPFLGNKGKRVSEMMDWIRF
ncbi:unnamed protein product [Trifolium pratense]|uniref:Uncharacterized protein n=1 Tax=Trifolium pratense TaxID=57577 RepID=A0ACB0IVT0_TRIPR|nr:unnamed protein product [Trifolium pratense]